MSMKNGLDEWIFFRRRIFEKKMVLSMACFYWSFVGIEGTTEMKKQINHLVKTNS